VTSPNDESGNAFPGYTWEAIVLEVPERPDPPRSFSARLGHWAQWVGVGRLATGVGVVIAVLLGAYWLVKPPPASSSSALPRAVRNPTTSSLSGHVSLAAPVAVPSMLVVDVAGAVRHGGVYRLHPGSRVVDAIAAAGGPSGEADRDAVNLAAVLSDGERIYLPRQGEPPTTVVGSRPGTTVPLPLDLNTATEVQLDQLPGVGPATAAAIVAHRVQHGPFGSVDDLTSVHGIGPAKLEALRGLVTV
jgi:competence protein ComEA